MSQLLQSLDEAPALAGEEDVAEVLRELRATALEPVLSWLPELASAPLRDVLEGVADRLATAHGARCCGSSARPSREALASAW